MDAVKSFRLISPAFKEGSGIPSPYTCKGQDVNPPLNIIGIPTGTKSLVLIMHDPDAAMGDFTHWLMWDIPASTEIIAAHSVPVGALQGVNDAGVASYKGPCPPAGIGVHHYMFELYALSKTLGLPGRCTRADLESAMKDIIIETTKLTGLFSYD